MSSLDDHHFHVNVDDVERDLDEAIASAAKKPPKKKRDSTLRKAPNAPKRFKSSYICFFMAKQPEIKAELGAETTVAEISKRSAELWKSLSQEERMHWDNVAAKDKQRYMVEKASYTGPWQIPFKRLKKDPSAPKRPMSAFLYFSQGRRTQIKSVNKDMKNTEISRILGEMWRNLTDEERSPFVEQEKKEREKYKINIAEWRAESEKKQEALRAAQAEQAQLAANEMQAQYFGGDPFASILTPVMPNPYAMYPPYPPVQYPTGPFQFPAAGKKPVILAPSGMPHYMMAGQSPSPAYPFEDGTHGSGPYDHDDPATC